MDRRQHWEDVYSRKRPTEVSWYQAEPRVSLGLIEGVSGGRITSVIDVGGGASTLVDHLVDRPGSSTTVLDVSAVALDAARSRLGPRADHVRWVQGDILHAELPDAGYDIWHDRAVFHFLTEAGDRRRYVEQVRRSVRVGGHVLVATFDADGPQKCSGLDVVRYSPDALCDEFGASFRLLRSVQETHLTPWGTPQKFVYCVCTVDAGHPASPAT
jgi:ubiquinone/menaquinone biosynthesis C-methylase UbiE